MDAIWAKAIAAKANEKRLDVTPSGSPDATAVGKSPEAAAKNVDLQSGDGYFLSIRVHRSFLLIFCFVFAEVRNSGVFCTCARVLLLRWS